MTEFNVFSPEIIIAFCAILTSVVSIILTIQTLKTQKQHNLKSVKPIGYIISGNYENDIYIAIGNNGIGPLIIKEFKVSNSRLSALNLIDIIPSNINDNVTWKDYTSNIVGRAIKSGDRIYLLRLSFDEIEMQQDKNIAIKKELREFLQDLILELTYTDIYEKETYNAIKNLGHFKIKKSAAKK